ncbi:MAG: nucleotidyltransferase domain-containing protein [Lacunisphaera sp.]|nr:nucleotidyltransferase domain-containing protein [Lacunisphaera sp.]
MCLLTILFPQVRAEVLRLLFADAAREVHVRDLERQSGLNVKTVQDELEKLTKADLVTNRRDGNRRYYRANARHPLFANLQQIVLKTAGLRDVLVQALAGVKGIEVAVVFGSLASGSGKAASDVDLLVIGDVGLRALAPVLRSAGQVLGREINPITMTAAEFKKGRRKNPLLVDILGKPRLFVKGDSHELGRLG